MILDGTLKDGEYKFYEDLGNGWVEEIKPPISAYGSINVDELNEVMGRLKKIPNFDELIKDNNKQDKEIQRLKNIIEELEKDCIEYLNIMNVGIDNGAYYTAISSPIQFIEKELKKIKELKEGKQ